MEAQPQHRTKIKTADNAFIVEGNNHVINYYPPQPQHPQSFKLWLSVLEPEFNEAVLIFDTARTLIYHNNKYGCLNQATAYDLQTLDTLSRYCFSRCGTNDMFEQVNQAYSDHQPKQFQIDKPSGDVLNCAITPIIDGGNLQGVVLKTKKKENE